MSNKRKWIVLDRGDVPKNAKMIEYTCLKCMTEPLLPVIGTPMAQCDQAIVFDIGKHAMPRRIRCPKCRSTLELCQ